MRPPRITTRRTMILVAIVALLMGTALEVRRLLSLRREYLATAENHRSWIAKFRDPEVAAYWEGRWTDQFSQFPPKPPLPSAPPYVPAISAYHARMQQKWEQAAARPWLSVEPDPL